MPRKKPPAPRRGTDSNLLERVSHLAQRAALLAALEATGWKLRETARVLGFVSPSGADQSGSVLRKIRQLDLAAEYEAHRETSG